MKVSQKYILALLLALFAFQFSIIAGTGIPPKDKLVMEPVPLNLTAVSRLIHYPDYALQQGIEAELPIQVLINTKGKIVAHRYTTQESKYFKDAIDPHLKKIKFKSASYNGKPMKAWITIQFEFKLQG